MYQRVKAYVEEQHMLEKKDRVIVGVSGGADSVCLLFMLVKLQKEMRFGLTVVHIHHGLRGESADADENYVRALCEKLDVELLSFHEDVGRYAKEQKLTLEEAGRNVRRHIFEEVCHRKNGTRIALAHHQNDNAETLLWNLSRGCGLKGIGGISPVDGKYIRPLLGVRRQEIEEYLKENYGINDVKKLKEKKACELGHIFALGTKYTESMNINFIDNENNSKPFYMGCYGIGVSRVLGLIYENNAIKENDKVVGVSLPLSVTPYYLYIISNDKKKESAEELYSRFNDKDIEVIIDDVKGSIGEKIRNAKVLGIPYIAIMGNNTEDGYVEIERTRDGAKKTVKVDELLDLVEKMKKEKKDIEF